MKIPTSTLCLLAAALLLPACREKASNDHGGAAASPLSSFLVEEISGKVMQISEIFEDPTPGREVILAGEVMGRMEPFVANRAMVVLGDPTKITPCNRIPGDECPTPWDNCCDDPEVLKKSVATIQFLDESGGLLRSGLKGFRGIGELSYLTVRGVIAEGSNAGNLLVTAKSFQLTDPSPYENAPPAADYSHHGHLGEVEEEDGEFVFKKNE